MKKVATLVVFFFTVTLMFSGCNVNTSVSINKEKMTSEETIELNGKETKEIKIQNVTGNININKVEGDTIRIKTERKVEGSTEEKVKVILDNIVIRAEEKSGKLEIKAVTKDGGDNFWSWLSDNHKGINVNINYYVDIPKDMESYNVNNVTGSIGVENLKGSFDVQCVTGNINFRNTILLKDNYIKITTGNVEVEADIDEASEVSVMNTTGNIKVAIPEDSKFSVEASVVTGSLGGNFEGLAVKKSITGGNNISQKFNGGNTKLRLELVTGNIDLNKK